MAPRYDHRTPRLFVDAPLEQGGQVPLAREQAHYLVHVMRLEEGDGVLTFNGRDGEFRATLCGVTKKGASLAIAAQERPQPPTGRIALAFAPLRQARLDYLVQKAVEMGAARILPVLTHHTQVSRLNTERLRANVIEAAEQCGILTLASVEEPVKLDACLTALTGMKEPPVLVFCDEGELALRPDAALKDNPHADIIVLIGPEGGFSEEERRMIRNLPFARAVTLGPRILRADTAAVVALALVQSTAGDL